MLANEARLKQHKMEMASISPKREEFYKMKRFSKVEPIVTTNRKTKRESTLIDAGLASVR